MANPENRKRERRQNVMKGPLDVLLLWGLSISPNHKRLERYDKSITESRLEHAHEIFIDLISASARASTNDDENSNDTIPSTTIHQSQFKSLLERLDLLKNCHDLGGSEDDIFESLDIDQDSFLTFDDFASWYERAQSKLYDPAQHFSRELILGRRTIHEFDQTPISPSVLQTAIECAISAPNHHLTEPWRFVHLGPQTLHQFFHMDPLEIATCLVPLNEQDPLNSNQVLVLTESVKKKLKRWATIPGWCVVTSKRSVLIQDDDEEEEDFAATCCAIQNMMLYLRSQGIGTKWVTGPIMKTAVFQQLCGINPKEEKFVGCIWYGYAKGGLSCAPPIPRKKSVDEVLTHLA